MCRFLRNGRLFARERSASANIEAAVAPNLLDGHVATTMDFSGSFVAGNNSLYQLLFHIPQRGELPCTYCFRPPWLLWLSSLLFRSAINFAFRQPASVGQCARCFA